MKILAIDASSSCTGWAVITMMPERELRLEDFGEIPMKQLTNEGQKLVLLYNRVRELIRDHKPNRIAIENIFRGPNTNTFKVLAEYRGACILAMAMEGYFDYGTYTAAEVRRRAFGDGGLKKDVVCASLSSYFGCSLKTSGMDQSDATAVAVAAANIMIPVVTIEPPVKKPRKAPVKKKTVRSKK